MISKFHLHVQNRFKQLQFEVVYVVFTCAQLNPLMVKSDAFKRHKWFHLLEKGQFSQEKVQMCENHQIRRADFGKKIYFFSAPPALKCTYTQGVSPLAAGFEGVQPRPHCSACMASAWA